MAYFPNTFGGLADCRLRISPQENSDNLYKIATLKNLDNKKYQFTCEMSASGLSNLQLLK
jgi:hypothetical protein